MDLWNDFLGVQELFAECLDNRLDLGLRRLTSFQELSMNSFSRCLFYFVVLGKELSPSRCCGYVPPCHYSHYVAHHLYRHKQIHVECCLRNVGICLAREKKRKNIFCLKDNIKKWNVVWLVKQAVFMETWFQDFGSSYLRFLYIFNIGEFFWNLFTEFILKNLNSIEYYDNFRLYCIQKCFIICPRNSISCLKKWDLLSEIFIFASWSVWKISEIWFKCSSLV